MTPLTRTARRGTGCSWDSGSQIVSRYRSQLADHPAAAVAKIREMTTKYDPENLGITVADTAANRLQLKPTPIGKLLSGFKVLEISVQDQPIPPQVLQAADEEDVIHQGCEQSWAISAGECVGCIQE